MAKSSCVVPPDKSVLQGIGFRCETGGNWSSRERVEGIAFGLYGIHSSAACLTREAREIYRPIHTRLKEEERLINTWRIQGGMS